MVLRLKNITKTFGKLTANDAISFDLHRGEVIALLGENGAGKTTLMNILFGQYTADAGEIEVFGARLPAGNSRAALEAGVGMVHQHFTLADQMSVTENILLGTAPMWKFGLGKSAAKARISQLSRDFGLVVDPDAIVGDLTVGERQRVEILKALYRDARILILDEPTAVLTPQEADDLFATLRLAVERGLSILFISHKLHEVMAISQRVIVLRHGKRIAEVATEQTDGPALAALMVGAEVKSTKVAFSPAGPALMRFKGVSTPAQDTVKGLQNLSFDLCAGQIMGLAGVSGNGQAALADLIGGLIRPSAGALLFEAGSPTDWSPRAALAQGIGRIPEDRHKTGSISDFTLTENAILEGYNAPPFSTNGRMDWRRAERHCEEIIQSYDVRCPGPRTPIRQLSGGNMQKLILGRALATNPKIILANQPVRGLDIGAVTYVQSRLLAARDAGAAILLISEDLDEITQLSDVIHVLSEGRLSPAFTRGEKTAAELGVWMAGHGFSEETDAA